MVLRSTGLDAFFDAPIAEANLFQFFHILFDFNSICVHFIHLFI